MPQVTVTAGLAIDLNGDDEGTTAVGFRRALAGLFRQVSPGVAAPGRLAADHFAVSGVADAMQYTVTGGGLVLVRGAANGAYLVGMPTPVTVPTLPADGVNSRYDRVYALQPDPLLDGADTDTQLIIGVVCGAAAGSPLVPALPAGAFELARKLIAPSATNTQSGNPFTNVAATTGVNLGDWEPARPVRHVGNPGVAISGVTIPQGARTSIPAFVTGMLVSFPTVEFGNGYMAEVALPFQNAVLSLQLTEIVADGATKSAGGIAFDVLQKDKFRAFYPNDPTSAKRAFTYLAIGY